MAIDVKAMADAAATAMKGFVTRSLAPMVKRVDTMEARLDDVQRRVDELEDHATRPEGRP